MLISHMKLFQLSAWAVSTHTARTNTLVLMAIANSTTAASLPISTAGPMWLITLPRMKLKCYSMWYAFFTYACLRARTHTHACMHANTHTITHHYLHTCTSLCFYFLILILFYFFLSSGYHWSHFYLCGRRLVAAVFRRCDSHLLRPEPRPRNLLFFLFFCCCSSYLCGLCMLSVVCACWVLCVRVHVRACSRVCACACVLWECVVYVTNLPWMRFFLLWCSRVSYILFMFIYVVNFSSSACSWLAMAPSMTFLEPLTTGW